MPALSHQSAETTQPSERLQPQTRAQSAGITQAQHEAWGPQSASHRQMQSSDHLQAFGHVTIDNSAQSDSFRNWCAKPFNELQPPPGLRDAEKELAQAGDNDRVLGAQVGTVKAIYGIANGAIELGNALVSPPSRLGNWLANTIVHPDTAISDSAKFGNDLGHAIVTGVKAVKVADAYAKTVEHAQAHGDYMKPLSDANAVMKAASEKFKTLTPGQQTAVISEQAIGLGTQIAAGKIFATAAEGFASMMQKMNQFAAKSDAVRSELGIAKEVQSATRALEERNDLAGAKNSRFQYEEIESYRSPEVPIQCHKNACVAAVGEMLSKGKIDQHTFLPLLEGHLIASDRGTQSTLGLKALSIELSKACGEEWEFKSDNAFTTDKALLQELLSTKHSFGVTLKAFKVEAHAVVVDGMNEAGRLVIRDPGDGKIYQMTKDDFFKHWTGLACAKVVH